MIIIGEKINASLPGVKAMIKKRDVAALLELAKAQAAAGARFIDVNVATDTGSRDDELQSMKWAVETIQEHIDTPLCIDSADPAVLEAGLEARRGRATLINSVKADNEHLAKVVPLAYHYESLLVGLAMDKTGIPKTVEKRLKACEEIAGACEIHKVPVESMYFDPLVLPVSSDVKQGLVTLDTLSEIKKRFPGANTVMGLSNVSYGLPKRPRLNRAFLHMAIYAGLDAAIMDPLDDDLMLAVRTGEALIGKDRFCRRYMRAFRK
jgi:5-methyltetrahydrofolate--homocysteine methyltransferase